MYLIGQIIGGIIGVYLLASIAEWAIFKRIMDDPVTGKLCSVAAAYVIAITVRTVTAYHAPTGFTEGLYLYLVPTLIVGAIFHRRGVAIRREETDDYVN